MEKQTNISDSQCFILATESCSLAPALGALTWQRVSDLSPPHCFVRFHPYTAPISSYGLAGRPALPLELPGRHCPSPRWPRCAAAAAPRRSRGRNALPNAGRCCLGAHRGGAEALRRREASLETETTSSLQLVPCSKGTSMLHDLHTALKCPAGLPKTPPQAISGHRPGFPADFFGLLHTPRVFLQEMAHGALEPHRRRVQHAGALAQRSSFWPRRPKHPALLGRFGVRLELFRHGRRPETAWGGSDTVVFNGLTHVRKIYPPSWASEVDVLGLRPPSTPTTECRR